MKKRPFVRLREPTRPMTRYLLAALLALLGAGHASADYLLIVVNLNAKPAPSDGNPGGQLGMLGGPPMAGGMLGMRGGQPQPGGMLGMRGMGGPPMAGGMLGMRGMPGPAPGPGQKPGES